jgi:hypothetical protein
MAMALATLLPATAGEAAAGGTSCRVKNATQETWFATSSGLALTRAIAAARSGDRLNVFGTCRGAYTPQVDLTIAGSRSTEHPTTLLGTDAGYILDTVPETDIRLLRLTLRGGTFGGLQVTEGATAVLAHSTVVGVSTTTSRRAGGGVLNGGDLTINSSRIVRNHSVSDGGGIFNFGDLEVNGSAVNRNVADGTGGGIFTEGFAVLNHSQVRFNTGGGILTVAGITLNDTIVSDNTPFDCGGC